MRPSDPTRNLARRRRVRCDPVLEGEPEMKMRSRPGSAFSVATLVKPASKEADQLFQIPASGRQAGAEKIQRPRLGHGKCPPG